MCTQFVVAKGFLVANPNLDLLIHNRIGLMNTLLSGTAGTLCSLGDTFLPRTVYSTHFAPWNILPLNTVYFLEHSSPWKTLLPGTLCSLEYFAP